MRILSTYRCNCLVIPLINRQVYIDSAKMTISPVRNINCVNYNMFLYTYTLTNQLHILYVLTFLVHILALKYMFLKAYLWAYNGLCMSYRLRALVISNKY